MAWKEACKQKLNSPFFVFSLLLVALVFFIPHKDTDFGWHWRYGSYFLETGKIMKQNLLTFLMPDYIWPHSYFLYQVFITFIYKHSGFIGLSLIYSLLAVVTYLIYESINPQLPKINLLFFLFIAAFGWKAFFLGFRAQIFTFTGLILIFYILAKFKEKPFLFYWLPLIFLFWPNLHGGFILGFILLCFALLNFFLEKDVQAFRKLSLFTFLSFLTSLINPYGFGIYQEAYRHFRYPLSSMIAEWVPPELTHQIIIFFVTILAILLLIAFKKKFNLFWLLVLISFSYLAFTSRRNLPFFGLSTAFFLFYFFGEGFKKIETSSIFNRLATLILVIGIPYLIFYSVPFTVAYNTDWPTYCQKGLIEFPCAAVKFIKANPAKGKNVFNPYNWGGFLEWQLPEYKFFVDGRVPNWRSENGKSLYTIHADILTAQPGYLEKLDFYKADWLFIYNGALLDLKLKENHQSVWQEIYRDKMAVIYTRK